MLKFKGQYIAESESDKEIACLSVREHVPDNEKYVVYLKSIVDYMSADQIRSYIQATEQLQPSSIVQAQMKESLIKQLKQKLHNCLMATDLSYRYEFEASQLKREIDILQQQLTEERKKRWEIENELFELKNSQQQESESKEETECQD